MSVAKWVSARRNGPTCGAFLSGDFIDDGTMKTPMGSDLTMSESMEKTMTTVDLEPLADRGPQLNDPSNAQKTRTWMRCLFDFLHSVLTEMIGCLVKS